MTPVLTHSCIVIDVSGYSSAGLRGLELHGWYIMQVGYMRIIHASQFTPHVPAVAAVLSQVYTWASTGDLDVRCQISGL